MSTERQDTNAPPESPGPPTRPLEHPADPKPFETPLLPPREPPREPASPRPPREPVGPPPQPSGLPVDDPAAPVGRMRSATC